MKNEERNRRGVPSDGVERGGAEHELQRELIEVKIAPSESEGQFPIDWNDDLGRPIGLLDIDHPLIQDAWAKCKTQLLADGVAEGDQLESYYSAFKAQVVGHVSLALTHIWSFLKAGNMALKDQLTSSAALTGIVAGIRHFEQAAQEPFAAIKARRGAGK
jgi:hypothetical protein